MKNSLIKQLTQKNELNIQLSKQNSELKAEIKSLLIELSKLNSLPPLVDTQRERPVSKKKAGGEVISERSISNSKSQKNKSLNEENFNRQVIRKLSEAKSGSRPGVESKINLNETPSVSISVEHEKKTTPPFALVSSNSSHTHHKIKEILSMKGSLFGSSGKHVTSIKYFKSPNRNEGLAPKQRQNNKNSFLFKNTKLNRQDKLLNFTGLSLNTPTTLLSDKTSFNQTTSNMKGGAPQQRRTLSVEKGGLVSEKDTISTIKTNPFNTIELRDGDLISSKSPSSDTKREGFGYYNKLQSKVNKINKLSKSNNISFEKLIKSVDYYQYFLIELESLNDLISGLRRFEKRYFTNSSSVFYNKSPPPRFSTSTGMSRESKDCKKFEEEIRL
jgi:hypothetical protein